MSILGLSSLFTSAHAANCSVDAVDSWHNGFIVQSIKNTSGKNLNGWQVELKFKSNIKLSNSWNVSDVKSTSRRVVLNNTGFNKRINNGSNFNAGFQGDGANIKAADIACNITSLGQSSSSKSSSQSNSSQSSSSQSSSKSSNNNQKNNNFNKPVTLPAKIQAEEYSKAYDTTLGNLGSSFRTGNVDIQATNDNGSQYNVGWIRAGEWLEYPVRVNATDRFDIYLRVASKLNTIKMQMLLDGKIIRSSLETSKTGAWQKFKDIRFTTTIPKGDHTLRVKFLSSNINLNYIHIVPASQSNNSDQTKPKPTPKPAKSNEVTFNANDFRGPLTSADQTPGGKQGNLKGSKPGQRLHRTGLSRYEAKNGVESFRAKVGGQLKGTSNSPRAEAYFPGNTSGKSFEATYQVKGKGDTTIFQQFGNAHVPSIRVVSDNGNLSVRTPNGNRAVTIGRIPEGQQFTMKVQDLGNTKTRINFYDAKGKLIRGGVFSNNRGGVNKQNTAYRYGAYYHGPSEAHVLVSNVKTNM